MFGSILALGPLLTCRTLRNLEISLDGYLLGGKGAELGEYLSTSKSLRQFILVSQSTYLLEALPITVETLEINMLGLTKELELEKVQHLPLEHLILHVRSYDELQVVTDYLSQNGSIGSSKLKTFYLIQHRLDSNNLTGSIVPLRKLTRELERLEIFFSKSGILDLSWK